MAFHIDSRSVEGEEYVERLFIALQRENVGYWPLTDIPMRSADVRFRGNSGHRSENVPL